MANKSHLKLDTKTYLFRLKNIDRVKYSQSCTWIVSQYWATILALKITSKNVESKIPNYFCWS